MAVANTEKAVNGNYGAHPNYNNAEAYQPGQAQNIQTSQSAEQDQATSNPSHTSIEVGWFFVEQYYNTMSKDPSRLHVRQRQHRLARWFNH